MTTLVGPRVQLLSGRHSEVAIILSLPLDLCYPTGQLWVASAERLHGMKISLALNHPTAELLVKHMADAPCPDIKLLDVLVVGTARGHDASFEDNRLQTFPLGKLSQSYVVLRI